MKLEKVYEDLLKEWVSIIDYKYLGKSSTMCILTTHKGYEVIGTNSSLLVDSMDSDIRQHFALIDAVKKLEELVSFFNIHK